MTPPNVRATRTARADHSLALAGQVVHARLDVLVVRVDLIVEESGLGVEGGVGLLQAHQLGFPTLAVPPLVSDVLQHANTTLQL